MKITVASLRRIIREVIEGGDKKGRTDIALYTSISEDEPVIKVVLYSPSKLLSLDDWEKRYKHGYDLPQEVIKGYAKFQKPSNPKHKCNGAWEVQAIAGIGYADILYGMGYRLVPGGRLMSDRLSSTLRARNAWTNYSNNVKELEKSPGVKMRFPLDDIENPQTPDPNDDCRVRVPVKMGGPDPILDVAYQGQQWNPGPLEQVHKDTIEKLTQTLNELGNNYTYEEVDEVVGEMLRSVGIEYFSSELGKYARERKIT